MRLLSSIMGLLVFMGALCGCGDYDNGSSTPTGSIVWEKTIGGPGNEVPHSIQATADGGYIVVGSTTAAGDEDS